MGGVVASSPASPTACFLSLLQGFLWIVTTNIFLASQRCSMFFARSLCRNLGSLEKIIS